MIGFVHECSWALVVWIYGDRRNRFLSFCFLFPFLILLKYISWYDTLLAGWPVVCQVILWFVISFVFVFLASVFACLWTLIWSFQSTLLRVNVMVEGLVRRNQTSYADSLPLGMEFAYTETESKNGDWNNVVATLVSHIDWVSLFEVIVRTAMRNAEQCIRLQAISIMNVILMRTNAFTEREK